MSKKARYGCSSLSRHSLWRRRIVAAESLAKTDGRFVIIDYLPILGTEPFFMPAKVCILRSSRCAQKKRKRCGAVIPCNSMTAGLRLRKNNNCFLYYKYGFLLDISMLWMYIYLYDVNDFTGNGFSGESQLTKQLFFRSWRND